MVGAWGLRLKPILTILLIAVITALMINRVVYSHIHVLSNGSLVSHAHPFSKSAESKPDSSHQHSNIEFFLLDQLDILILCATAAFVLKQFSKSSRFNQTAPVHLLTALVPNSQGRAPPICM